jgi:hypothetical protein
MRGLVLALIILGASSCCSVYTLTEINCCGEIVSQRSVVSEDGDMEYTAKIARRKYMSYTTFKRFQIGDTVCFKASGSVLQK